MTPDVVIRNGTILDGTGSQPLVADIAIKDGLIAEVGRIETTGADELDARGLCVAPGFIDIHSHSDYTLLVDPRAVSAIHQGVTLEVIGNCGFGCAPIRDPALSAGSIYGFDGSIPLVWRGIGEYLEHLQAARPAVNVLTLVPNAQLRLGVVGMADRPAGTAEIERMAGLLRDGLAEGAWGYSTGLEYPAESAASEAEITALCRVVAKTGGLYATHTRDRDHHAIEAIDEAIRTAERSDVRLQISHLLPRLVGGGVGERCVERIESAAARGLDIGFDMHTRRFGFTLLSSILPPWALAGGRGELASTLRSAEARARMKSFPNIVSGGGWDRIELVDAPASAKWSGRSLGAIGREMGRDPHELACEVLLAEIDHLHRPKVLIRCYDEDDQERIFRHPSCIPASDATTLAPDGRLAGASFHGAYSWAAWFFRFMVEVRRALTPEAAVHRLTGLPARRLGLADRGVIAKKARADIAIFAPQRFRERATVEAPNRLAEGMVHVLVNGALTLRDGRPTSARKGEVIRQHGPPPVP